jgi:hypothetical protein
MNTGSDSPTSEKLVYQARRSGAAIFNSCFSLVLAGVFAVGFLVLSGWAQNIMTYSLPGLSSQADTTTAQVVRILGLGSLVLAGFLLIFGILQLITALGSRVTLTDQRVTGKTGTNLLRRFNIPLENIAWVEYPNRILAKGPVTIHTRDGRETTLRNMAKAETFLGYLENAYPEGNRPTIRRETKWGQAFLLIIGLALIGFAIYFLLNDRQPAVEQPGSAANQQAVAVVETAIPLPTDQPTLEPTATKRPTTTPKPKPVEVDFASLGSYPVGTQVILVGRLGAMSNAFCDGETCSVVLKNIENTEDYISIFINLPPEGATPAPNQMKGLFEGFQQSDIRVRTDDGSYALIKYRIRVHGRICETTDGSPCITDITKIELVQAQ